MAYNISLNTTIIDKDMNPRIKQLAEQADILFLRDGTIMPGRGEADIQKFAELIVQQCAHFITETATIETLLGDRLKEHFGVE